MKTLTSHSLIKVVPSLVPVQSIRAQREMGEMRTKRPVQNLGYVPRVALVLEDEGHSNTGKESYEMVAKTGSGDHTKIDQVGKDLLDHFGIPVLVLAKGISLFESKDAMFSFRPHIIRNRHPVVNMNALNILAELGLRAQRLHEIHGTWPERQLDEHLGKKSLP
jgi:hypothetical protein